jgi:hypothetical protein
MKNQVKTTYEDGWGCVHQFGQMTRKIKNFNSLVCEIDKCVRIDSTDDIIFQMEDLAEYLLEKCKELRDNGIDKTDFVTIEDKS